MRNLQKNLIPKWNTSNKISELIEQLPNLCNNFEYQISKGLLPSLGEYYINSYNYDINDFLRNQNNKFFKISVPYKNEDEEKTYFTNRYFVITSIDFIILEPVNEKFKNICKINYVGDLFEIDQIQKFLEKEEEYNDFTCFKVKWENHYNNKFEGTLCGESKKLVVKNISECLLKRKETIKTYFKLIQNSESANINKYEEIIKIKEKLIEDKTNDAIYEEINNLYQKIIEVLSSFNGEGFKKYLEKLKKFMDSYDKLKMEENKKKELLKGNIDNNNKNGANTKEILFK